MAEEVGGQQVDAVSSLTLLLPTTVRRITVVAVGARRRTCCKQLQTNSLLVRHRRELLISFDLYAQMEAELFGFAHYTTPLNLIVSHCLWLPFTKRPLLFSRRSCMMTRIFYSHDGRDGRTRNIYWLFSRVLLYK